MLHCAGSVTRTEFACGLPLVSCLLPLFFHHLLQHTCQQPLVSPQLTALQPTAPPLQSVLSVMSNMENPVDQSFNPGSSNSHCSNLSSAYLAIKKIKMRSLVTPALNGGVSPTFNYGSFRNTGDNRTSLAFERHVFEKKVNVSFSFDPSVMQCVLCLARGPHEIVNCSDRSVFVLSDQSFPAVLPSTSEKDCIRVIRVENGSLWDLVNSFLDVTRGHSVPKGSVVVISSAVHLADMGTTCYISDLQKIISKLGSVFRGGLIVLPGIPICLGGTDDPSLVRSIVELLSWLSSCQPTPPPLAKCYQQVIDLLADECQSGGGVQTDYVTRLVLPTSLDSVGFKKWVSAGWGSIPCELPPVDQCIETKLIKGLISELNVAFELDLDDNVSFSRGQDESSPDKPRDVLVVGASHANRLSEQLELLGHSVERVCQPGWRATKANVASMLAKVEEVISSMSQDCLVIFWLLDNSLYFARSDEGGFNPPKRGSDGIYHVEGEVMLAPVEVTKQVVNNCLPIITAVGSRPKLFITPLARYTSTGCCADINHATNCSVEDFVPTILDHLDLMRSNIKDYCFRGGVRRIKYLNFSRMAVQEDDELHWADDPVHPTSAVYSKAAVQALLADKHLSEGLFKKGSKRKQSSSSSTLQDWEPSVSIEVGPPRPQWLDSESVFTKRFEGQRGRGRGFFGRRGRRGRF